METPTRRTQIDKLQAGIVDDGLLTVGAAAQFLSLGKSTVYNLMESGRLAYVKIGGARRIPKRALLNLAQEELRSR